MRKLHSNATALIFAFFAIAISVSANGFFDLFKSDSKSEKVDLKREIDQLENLRQAYQISDCSNEGELYSSFYAQEQKTIALIQEFKSTTANSAMFLPPQAGCPDMQVIELLGVPGFAETDELVVCGEPDTLALLVFIEEPGSIGGTQMSVTFNAGMQYAGFESTHYNGTTISNLDPSSNKPTFLLEGITDAIFVAYIGVEATCDADINAFEYMIDLDFNFVFESPAGGFTQCRQGVTPVRVYNSTIKNPVINYRNNPITTVTELGVETCTYVNVSQDGLGAYLNELEFSICGIDLQNEVQLNSISVNGTTLTHTYNATDSTVMTTIPSDVFSDGKMDESEQISIVVCYQADDCPLNNTQLIQYKTRFGCNGDTCEEIFKDSEIRIRPNTKPEPFTSVTRTGNPGICGAPTVLDLNMFAVNNLTDNVAIQDSARGLFTDLTIGFEACATSSMEISKITMNGAELPTSLATWVNEDLVIDFTTLTSDPDGPGGLTDADGDMFFDDLPGDQELNVTFEMSFVCELPADPTSINCGSVDCTFANIVVRAKRDCGQSFTSRPPIEEFSIINGATSVGYEGTTEFNNLVGYNFGQTGMNCSALAQPIRSVEFCYTYERENVDACGGTTDIELQVVYSGSPILVNDVEYVPGSAMISVGGGAYTTGVDGTWTTIDATTRMLSFPYGDPTLNSQICYKYDLQADSTLCTPPVYAFGTHQVIETCTNGGCTCQTVLACDKTVFKSDPRGCDCICDITTGGFAKRISYGYLDEQCLVQATEADITDQQDFNRYLVNDTMYYDAYFIPNTAQVVDDPYEWSFAVQVASDRDAVSTTTDLTEVSINASESEIVEISYSKVGSGGVRTTIDFTSYNECIHESGSSGLYAYNVNTQTPFSGTGYGQPIGCNTGSEWVDNNRVSFNIRNLDDREDCDGIERGSWQEDSDCLKALQDDIQLAIGDTIWMSTKLVLSKNIQAHARMAIGDISSFEDPMIVPYAGGNYFDPFDDNCLVALTNCREALPFFFDCPNGITAITNYNVDDCGGEVSHTFSVTETPNINWYADEYRPYYNLGDIKVPIYAPTMYCGNPVLTTKGGKVMNLTVKDYIGHDCTLVNGTEYCAVSSGSVGYLVFNLEDDGYEGMLVGKSGYLDEFTITYDLCRICPADLEDEEEFEIEYSYKIGDVQNGACYNCNQAADGTSNDFPQVCQNSTPGFVHRLQSYYNFFNLDTLFIWENVEGEDFVIVDNSNGFGALSLTQDVNLLSSGSPTISEELNTYTICADNTDPTKEVHMNVIGSVTMPSTIVLTDIYDASMNPITTSIVANTGSEITYSFPLGNLDTPGVSDCVTFKVGTTLQYCPEPPEIAEVCVNVTSGCSDPAVMAALASTATPCNSTGSCYRYVTEEAGIQADFISPGEGATYPLCSEIPIAVLVKNVKEATVTDLILDIDLPLAGATPVLGSFEASYPNSGDLNGTFYSIPDPAINGAQLLYAEDNDFSNYIHANGFPGVASTLDSNFIVVRFLVTTDCDQFVSGSQASFNALATDPCSPNPLNSGASLSEQIIIDGANPTDFAQILVTAKPAEAYCGAATPTFTITGQNISQSPSGDSVLMCITLPEELTYYPGSMRYAIPTGQSTGIETITMIGTETQVCFAGYNNMPVGGAFTINFEAEFDITEDCGDYRLGVDIKELVEAQACVPGPPATCDVFVQSSVNPYFTVTLKGPMEMDEAKLFRSCDGGENPIDLCYELKIINKGPDYNGDITIDLHGDITANQFLDIFDPILGTEVKASSVASGDTLILTGCFTVDEINACPVIINATWETPCSCNSEAIPVDNVEPEFMSNLPGTSLLCPGQELGLDTCGMYTFTYDPPSNIIERPTDDSLYLSVVDPSILTRITVSGTTGLCNSEAVRFLQGVTGFDLDLLTDQACEDQSLLLGLTIPEEYQSWVTVQWSPATYLDDATRIDPLFNAPDPGTYDYEITLMFNDGCELTDNVSIEVLPTGDMGIGGDLTFCDGYAPGMLTTDAGFDYYEWYLLSGGFEIIQASTTDPNWSGPTQTGDYIVKGFRSTDPCPFISGIHTITAIPCVDIELEKTIVDLPYPAQLGDIITYEIEVCNVLDPALGLVHTQDNVTVDEQLPAGLTYTGSSTTIGSYTPGSPGMWTIGSMTAGQCDTLTIMASIDMFGTFTNVAEVTGGDTPDVDSEVDNDDGDQSEDDEDPEVVTIPYVDLALTKMLDPSTVTPVTVGDDVNFIIEVCNQGTITMTNIEVTDYVPAGYILSLADANGWADNDNDGLYENTIPGPLAEDACAQLNILLTVQAASSNDDYINVAEISGSEDDMGNDTTDDDVDSTADEDDSNDPGGEVGGDTDDTTDNENGDEDDSDPATVPVEYVDLALTKVLAVGQTQNVAPGDMVEFTIEVCNQGSVDAYNVGVIDYIPSGFIYDDAFGANTALGWSDSDSDGNPETSIAGPIAAYTGCDMVNITLQVDPALSAPADLTNVAEITGSENMDGSPQDDIDSDPDDDPDNDGPMEDNTTDGSNGDEDDSDPETVNVTDTPVFDLALVKTLDPSVQTPVYPGDIVTFNIEVINQGTIDAYNIELTEAMGGCLNVINPEPNGWVDSDNDGVYENVIPGVLTAGTSQTIQIEVEISCASADQNDYLNIAEISAAEDEDGNHPPDEDSTPDMDPFNDPMDPEDNNETSEDGMEGEDEDDNDWEFVPVETFDLALVKKLKPGQPMPIQPGDLVTFAILVGNQGTVDAYNVDIIDYVPSGLTYDDSFGSNAVDGWNDSDADGNPENTINAIVAGQFTVIDLTLQVNPGVQGDLTNWSEITDAEDEDGNHPEDVDSTPDDDPNNDVFGDDNQNDGDGTDDEDDHDPATITVDYFDLALTKVLSDGQSQYVAPGDDVSFTIEVCNQGTIVATDVSIAEYPPVGTVYSSNDTNAWTDVDMDGIYENTILGPIAPGACESIDFVITVLPTSPTPYTFVNVAEISGANDGDGNPADDIDSDPDSDPDNDAYGDDNQTDGDGTDDEDDSDPAEFEVLDPSVEVYDLALEKDLDPSQAIPVYPGNDITFIVTITNQSNAVVTNVNVEDYLPAYLTLSTADTNGWVDADADGNPDQVIPSMTAGEVVMIPITVTLDAGFSGTEIENSAEITSFEDEDGNPQDDTDSTPDDDPDNDPDDEDDEDTEVVPTAVFDLALTKTFTPGQMGPFMPGMDVTFTITVYNQGTVDAYNVDVVDYLPSGLTLSVNDMNGWTDADADGNPENTIVGPIVAGQYSFVDITLTIDPNQASPSDLMNFAEITEAEDVNGNNPPDTDSTPDDDPDNDEEGGNDQEDGDGTDDEDDHDWETIPVFDEIFDLALKKVINPSQTFPVGLGDDITFDIWVYNQGNVPATNIEVSEYIPSGTMMSTADMNGWTDFDNDGTYEQTIAGPLAAGDSTLLMVVLTITDVSDPLGLVNASEISGADDENGDPVDDIDSTPDGDPDNDNGGNPDDETNDEIDDDGTNDEDDHDPELIPIFDLALTKTTSQTDPISYGDVVPFDINVINQGNQAAYNVEVTEYIPCGYQFQASNSPLWTYDAVASTATATIAGPIAAAATYTLPLELGVQPCSGDPATNWTNAAEISGAEDDEGEDMSDQDPDSTPDDDPDNDEEGDNDQEDGDGEDDEDDHDWETPPIFDLALNKVLAPGTVTPATLGDDVTMIITVFNQGTVNAANVEISEFIPAGFSLSTADANGWADVDMDGVYTNTIVGPINAGDFETVEIVLTVEAGMSDSDYVNVAEISGSQDDMGNDTSGDDIDSDADDNPHNDNGGDPFGDTNDETDDDGTEDEDDSDPEFVPVEYTDLALTKSLAPGQPQQVMAGDMVDFEVKVYNQGTIDAYNVNVIDYIPSGLIYDDAFGANASNGWSDADADGNPDKTFAGPIAKYGGCETIVITLQVDPALSTPANLKNVAEITGSEDEDGNPQDDVDSTPDDDPDNETGENDDETTDPDDEDDSDPAEIGVTDEPIFDLALIKTLDPSVQTPIFPGDIVIFNIEVTNQGSEAVYDVEITDNMGACLDYSSATDTNGWVDSDNDGAYENLISGPMNPGDVVIIPMEVIITCAPSSAADVTNIAEISAADDEDGNPIDDIDSTPDMDPNNDGPSEDNENEDPNDEDDHDPEVVPVEVFDLALTKILSPDQTMPIMPGDDVTFIINICNQGTVDAFNIDVVEYTPSGMTISTNDFNGWTDVNSDGNYENTIAGVPSGECQPVEIIMTIDPSATGSLMNQAEISDAEDENGDHPDDKDSNPNDDPNDDPMGDDNQEDGDGTDDEDDHDWEEISLGSWDLALVKTLASGQSAYIMPGDNVDFTIEVINQGTMDAYNVDIAEYLPAGMTLSTGDANGWTDINNDGVLENTIAGPVTPGTSQFVNLQVTISPTFSGTSLTNTAEVSDFEDDMGNHPEDNDSKPDDDPNNDPYGDNDQEDGDGTDDEDDSDPEEVFISTGPVYDLALDKELDPSQVTPVYPGGDVMFVITVANQSNAAVTNVRVEDYFPTALTLSTADTNGWVDDDADGNPDQIIASMTAGEVVEIAIVVTIDASWTGGTLENRAEVTDFEDENGDPQDDTDSTPDDDPDNDPEEEDDEDGDEIEVAVFDLALNKTLAPGQTGPFAPGMDVTFRIEVENQGNVPAYNVVIDEYLPAAFSLSSSDTNGWADIDADGNLENTIAGPIAPGSYEFVDITVTIDPAFVAPGNLENRAEISEAEDENGNNPPDTDSDPDGDPGDPEDEDDEDGEMINVFEGMFDLALKKVLDPGQARPIFEGDDITFFITVYNQGNIDATNIEVTEYIPVGTNLSVNDANGWTDNDNDGIYEQTVLGPLKTGDSLVLKIVLTLDDISNPMGLINEGEISGADDQNGNPVTDIDSTPDDDPNNDNGGNPYDDTDDETGDDGTDDEDDHDPAILPVFDLALTKFTNQTLPVIPGDVVTYVIRVMNQGNVVATDMAITDYIPTGLLLSSTDANGWVSVNDSTATNIIAGPIMPGAFAEIEVDMEVQPHADVSNLTNFAEITSAKDDDGKDITDQDIDSDSDNERDNDGDIEDNAFGNENGDEDDHDPSEVPVFDLALQKVANPIGPYALGDIGTFDLYICNQGNITAANIEVTDYLPVGLILDAGNPDNANWSSVSVSEALYKKIDGPLLPGECDTISIHVELVSVIPLELLNMAEISYAEDDNGQDMSDRDVDSQADNDNSNDIGNDPFSEEDDKTAENGRAGEDEDDHDQAFLLTCLEMACLGEINLSLDDTCEANLSAAMLLADAVYPESMYEITLTDEFGNPVDQDFDVTDIGKCYNYSVSVPLCMGQSCWGKICLEDKFPPAIDCGPVQEVFACSAPSADLTAVTPPTISTDNCDGAELLLVSETTTTNDDCDPDDLLATIVRCYRAVDAQGNESPICCQTIEVKRIVTGSIDWPAAFSSTDCTISTGTNVTGVPSIGGVPIFPSVPSSICNLMVSFEDMDLQEDGCHRQFLRMWTVNEWWCGGLGTPVTFGQLIEVRDVTPPSITCPADMTVSTGISFGECESTFTLPAATVSDDCNSPVEVDIITGESFIDANGGEVTLTVGVHTMTYVAYDGCYNSSTCTMTVTVVDENQPTILCDEFTVVSLNNTGIAQVYAEVFDDGSFDDCGIDRFEVRRMNDPCGITGNTEFGEHVTFCCADIGNEVMVALRVYDVSGNFNDCMTMVEVQDKSVADIQCIPDETIFCPAVYDVNDLAAQFGMPTIIGATCTDDFPITEGTPVVDVDNCGLGTIRRSFSASNGQGGTLTCTQLIRIINDDPFDGDDPTQLQFPLDFTSTTMCDFTDATPDNLPFINAFPIITEDACDLVGFDFEDQLFTFANDPTACFKIIRTWTVIDWCQRRADGTFQEWTHVQEIKILNDTDPVITSGLDNQVVESIDVSCNSEFVTLGITAEDDCPTNAPLSYSYEIDLRSNGTIDRTGTTSDASGTYPIGIHTIFWLVLDGCGNEAQGSSTFEVRNIKAPVAICIQGLSIDLTMMDTDGDNLPDTNMAVLWASDFDQGSYHPCGYDVTLSFSSDPTDTNITFDCDDIGQPTVQLWVTDENGNQTFCSTFIDVQDNDGDCPDTAGIVNVSGRIFTESDESVEDVEVELIGGNQNDMTVETGTYDFTDMPMGGAYTVDPGKNDDVMNGVSTLDLVLIQKHLLQFKELDSPYKRIAADVNHDEKISSIDLIQLRKLILGIYEEFPDNESWRFVDALHVFPDLEDPWFTNFEENYVINTLDMNMWIDFVGVKIGDVNGSVTANFQNTVVEKRSGETLTLKYADAKISKDEEIRVAITADNFEQIAGLQYTLEHKGLQLEGVEAGSLEISEAHIGKLENGVTTFSWNELSGKLMSIDSDKELFTIIFRANSEGMLSEALKLNNLVTKIEAYQGTSLEILDVALESNEEIREEGLMALHQNEPNPWSNSTIIKVRSQEDGESVFTVKDANGKLILSKTITLSTGMNEIVLTNRDVQIPGVYNYSINMNGQQLSRNMIKVE